MRVAIIHPFLFRYARGIERYTFNLANALIAQGTDVTLLTWHWSPPVAIDELDPRVTVRRFRFSRYFAAQAVVPFYLWQLWVGKFDFVWIFFAGYGEAEALTLARGQRFGIVFHFPVEQVPHRYREFLRYGIVKRAAALVSVSQYVAKGVRRTFGRDSVVIPHGVDTARFAQDAHNRARMRQELDLQDALVLVTAAALEERKGIQWVLNALPFVLQTCPNVMYLVLGEGPYRARLEERVRARSLSEHVRLLGAQADIVPYFQCADVALILARGEASSLAALEALACGVPVIASKQPPFDELVDANYSVCVDETDAAQVAREILKFANDTAMRQRMGAHGRARVMRDFTWARVARAIAELASDPGANG